MKEKLKFRTYFSSSPLPKFRTGSVKRIKSNGNKANGVQRSSKTGVGAKKKLQSHKLNKSNNELISKKYHTKRFLFQQ